MFALEYQRIFHERPDGLETESGFGTSPKGSVDSFHFFRRAGHTTGPPFAPFSGPLFSICHNETLSVCCGSGEVLGLQRGDLRDVTLGRVADRFGSPAREHRLHASSALVNIIEGRTIGGSFRSHTTA